MSATFIESIQHLSATAKKEGIHYNLDHIKAVLALLSNPHKSLDNIIHIAGTNGKGSTLRAIEAGLQEAGHSVATFTSPHLTCYTERITFNGQPIPKKDFKALYDQLQLVNTSIKLTEFESFSEFHLLLTMFNFNLLLLITSGI